MRDGAGWVDSRACHDSSLSASAAAAAGVPTSLWPVPSGSVPVRYDGAEGAMGSDVTGSSTHAAHTSGHAARRGDNQPAAAASRKSSKDILADPVVAGEQALCGNCQRKVTLESGCCPFSGNAYSFEAA